VPLVELRRGAAHQVISDRPAGRREIPPPELDRDFASGADEAADRQEARERERLEQKSGESEMAGERGHDHADDTREGGDAEGERRTAGQEPHGRAVAEPPPAGREQPAEPCDGMVAVRGIAESQVDGEGQQQNERLRDLGAQDLGNESLASLATAPMSTARATASARCSYRSPAGVPHRGSEAMPFRSAKDTRNARRRRSFAKRP
jgi:hypothetical protein